MLDWKRRMMMLAALGATIALGACGDDGESGPDPETDTGVDAGDTGGDDVVDTDVPDDSDSTCEQTCTSTRDCGTGNICEDGCCVEEQIVPPCSQHLGECSDAAASNDLFFCDTTENRCLSRCDRTNVDETNSSDCPFASFCGSEAPSPAGDLDGLCIPGDCDTNIFDEDACDGIGTCIPLGNEASFCFDSGTADVGDGCNLDPSNNPPATDICGPGLICFLNVCEEPCNRTPGAEPACTVEGEECIGIYNESRRNRPGVCAESCEPFGSCETGRCAPLFANSGSVWTCVDDGPDAELIAEGGDCSADDAVCAEGLLCFNQGSVDDPDLQCSRYCDVFGIEEGTYAGCAPGEATFGDVLIEETAFGEASGFLALPAATYDVVIRTPEDDLIAETDVPVAADQAYSVVYFWGAEGLDRFIASPEFEVGDTLPTTGVRAIHASPDAGIVDIIVIAGEEEIPFASGVAFQDATSAEDSSYNQVDAGAYTIRLVLEDESTVDSPEVVVEENTLYTIVAGGSVADETFGFFVFADEIPELAQGEGAVRLLHMADVAPNVVVYGPDVVGESSEVCSPTNIEGFGFCQPGCNPYPRSGVVGGYGCDDGEDDTQTCRPFVATDTAVALPQGLCDLDEGTALGLEDCNNSGFLGGDCADFAVCLGDDDNSDAGVCLPLCEPVSVGQCAAYEGTTCSAVPPLLGQLNFSFCTDTFTAGESGGSCDGDDEGNSCEADSTLCLDLGSGPICHPICREGIEGDCPDGLTCRTGNLNPDLVPSFMGLCQ